MANSDDKDKIRRPVIKVPSTGQIQLFAGPKPAAARHQESTSVEELRFTDPDPEALAFGDVSLRNYLQSAGLGFAFVIRALFDSLDWSIFEARYKAGGRPPYSPRRMTSLIVYGISQGVNSLRELELLARRDLVALWLTGGICPDHSKIGRFIQLHEEELAATLFESMTKAVLKQLPEVNKEVGGDGTIVEASASRFVRMKKEAAEKWAQDAQSESDDDPSNPDKLRQAELAKECVAAINERAQARINNRSGDPEDVSVNPSDPDSIIHKFKRGGYGYAYIGSLMVNRDRIILSQTVHPSSENAVIESQLEQVERVLEGPPQRLCLDAGYFCHDILSMAVERNLDLLCPAPEQAKGAKKPKKFAKHSFVYDTETDTYECPAGQVLIPTKNRVKDKDYQYYKTRACNEGCDFRDQCTEAERGRRIKREKDDILAETMRKVMNQPAAQRAYGHRQGSVEPVFGEQRHIQEFNRFKRSRLSAVKVEYALHAMAHNLRRLLVIWRRAVSYVFLCLFEAFRSAMEMKDLPGSLNDRKALAT